MKKEDVKAFEEICEQAVEIGNLIDNQKEEYETVGYYISDIQKIENMSPEKRDELAGYAKMFQIIEKDKKEYKQESEIVTNIEYQAIKDEEPNLPKILQNMEENEKRYSMVKGDLRKLEGERQALQMEWSYLKERGRLYQGLMKVIIVSTVILMIVYAICMGALEINMTVVIYATIAIAAFLVALLLLAVAKTKREMKIIELKNNKAIGLQNRIKLKYVNAYNGLDFMYEKYDVNSSYELSKKWQQYDMILKNREVYKAASQRLYELNGKILEALESEKLYDSSIWLTQVNALYDNKEMERIKEALYSQRQSLRNKIQKNVEAMDIVKEKLKEMIASDPENAKVIMKILAKYGDAF